MTNKLTAKQKKQKQKLEDEIIAAYKKYAADLIKLDISAANPRVNHDLDNLQKELNDLKLKAKECYDEKFFIDSIVKAKTRE